MKSIYFSLLILGGFIFSLNAQVAQFAVVRPDGTTFICPNFDSAYNKAADDDIIYMPGVVIEGDKTISKRLKLIGTGHYPDSTLITNKTYFNANIHLEKKCWLEGFECMSIDITNASVSGCSFVRLRINANLNFKGTNNHLVDGSIVGGLIIGIEGICPNAQFSSEIMIKNSIINAYLYYIKNSYVFNCIFYGDDRWMYTQYVTFTNCVFNIVDFRNFDYDPCAINHYGNVVRNSINCSLPSNPPYLITENNFANISPNSVFVNLVNGLPAFNYVNNYHLQDGSPYLTAGDDGGQIGIYGGPSPYIEGAVPTNPHIYFKQVPPQTNTNGQLPVQIKVRTNN